MQIPPWPRTGLFAALMLGTCTRLAADVKLAAIFTDNAVLQRGIDLPVWGTANDGELVTVRINGQSSHTVTSHGRWAVRLKPMTAGGPFKMTVSGEQQIEIKGVLIGDVWLCGGQSNMKWPLSETENAGSFISQSKDDDLRLFTVPLATATAPTGDISGGQWEQTAPDTVREFSAVAYHFGRILRKQLGVPVGLIDDSYGGSIVQAWTSNRYIMLDPESSRYVNSKPDWAEGPQNGYSLLYNGMIAPIIPFGIRGVIWYQGEGNTVSSEADHYKRSFPLLIRNWRTDWGQGDFPFIFVQLAPWSRDAFFHVSVDPEGTGWAVVREAQLETSQNVKNTAMAVITDVGDENHIHPRKKEPVGRRLAEAALAIAYHQNVAYKGPMLKSMKVDNSTAVLSFEDDGGGLAVQGKTITGFAVAGADKKFYPAQGRLVGKMGVELRSERVTQPIAVRYGWSNFPVVNLFSLSGLPMSPFRTDTWPPEKPFKTNKWPP